MAIESIKHIYYKYYNQNISYHIHNLLNYLIIRKIVMWEYLLLFQLKLFNLGGVSVLYLYLRLFRIHQIYSIQ